MDMSSPDFRKKKMINQPHRAATAVSYTNALWKINEFNVESWNGVIWFFLLRIYRNREFELTGTSNGWLPTRGVFSGHNRCNRKVCCRPGGDLAVCCCSCGICCGRDGRVVGWHNACCWIAQIRMRTDQHNDTVLFSCRVDWTLS